MRVKLEHRLGVKAPAHVIWEILADLPAWSDWNPLYPEAKGVIGFGGRLTVTEVFPGKKPKVIHPTIIDWTPNEDLHWKGSALFGLVSTIRYLEIEKMHDEGCIFSNGEVYEGLFRNTYARRNRRRIRAGFTALGEALRDRAEARWRAAGGTPT